MSKQNLTFKIPTASKQVKDEFREKRDRLELKLPQFIEFAAAYDSNYNNAQGFEQIRNVFYGRKADLTLTKMLDDYETTINQNQSHDEI